MFKGTIVVCVMPPVGSGGQIIRKTYGTFRNDLIRMRVWLKQLKVTEIAMESTGVYWRSVWNVLEEGGFRLLLVNPAQVKALAGRKSDGRDAQRIAEYLQDGRLDGSFVPSAEIRQLRMMLRHRVDLLEQRNQVHNQIRDLFETASIKLSSVVSDLMGVTGRRIVEAMIAGQDSPEILSWKVKGKLLKKEKLVKESLKGYFNDFHRSMLESHYKHYPRNGSWTVKSAPQWLKSLEFSTAPRLARWVTSTFPAQACTKRSSSASRLSNCRF